MAKVSIQDGEIKGEVDVGPASISANINPNDIEAATVGMGSSGIVPGGSPLLPGGGEVSTEISIGGKGVGIELGLDSKNIGLGGNVDVDIAPGGERGGVEVDIDFGGNEIIDLDAEIDGCTISVQLQLWGGQTVTQTFTNPKCKQPEASPSPSPSPTPSPGGAPNFPPGSDIKWVRKFLISNYQQSSQVIETQCYKVLSGAYSVGFNNSSTTSSGKTTHSGYHYYYRGPGDTSFFDEFQFEVENFNPQTGASLGVFTKTEGKIVSCSPTPTPTPTPTPPHWNSPPKNMADKCCDASTSMMRKIMKVLAVEEIEKNGIKIPKEFLAPGGTGQLKVNNYAELQLNLFRTVNRYGIDTPIVVKIKDVNKAKAGDQSTEFI